RVAVVEPGVVEAARPTRGLVGAQGLHEALLRQMQGPRQRRQARGAGAGKHGWHEPADRLGVDDRVRDLARLARDEAAPDGVALGPEILALIVKALALLVYHHAQRNAVDARADAAVIQRRAGIDRDHVRLGRVTDAIGAGVEQAAQQHA